MIWCLIEQCVYTCPYMGVLSEEKLDMNEAVIHSHQAALLSHPPPVNQILQLTSLLQTAVNSKPPKTTPNTSQFKTPKTTPHISQFKPYPLLKLL